MVNNALVLNQLRVDNRGVHNGIGHLKITGGKIESPRLPGASKKLIEVSGFNIPADWALSRANDGAQRARWSR